jgi:hypothetical protein
VGRRHIIVTCLAAVTLVPAADLLMSVSPAAAQATLTNVSPLPQRRIEQLRRATPPVDSPDDPDLPPPPQPRAPTADDGDTPDDTTAPARDGDDPQRVVRQGNRDGEPEVGEKSQLQQQDGVVPTGESEPLRDGEPDTERDPRLKSDVDAFEKPAAGYDDLAFQIDQIDPVLDRRPARLARFEPFDPLGIKRGTWVIFPEIEFGIGGTTNIRRSAGQDASGILDVRPTVRAITNWRQHAVELRATGFATALPGFASEADKAYALEARGRIDFSKRSNMEMLFSHQLDQDSRQSRDAVDAARTRANFVTNRAAIALNNRFNRLTVQLRGSVTDVNYDGVATNTGFASNDQRDVTEYGTAARASWEFKPSLFLFTDVALNDRNYRASPTDGISRDSRGLRAVAGLSFGSAGRIWRGEVSAGYGQQRPDDARLSSTGGLILDANLGWRANALTSLLFTARTDFNDSTTAGQSGSRAQTFGIEARHAFRRHLVGIASLRNTSTDYRGVSLSERETVGELGFDWFLNRTTTITGRYAHTDFGSSAAGGDYTVDTVRFGVRVRQ